MQNEYDFKKGTRGKFYNKDIEMNLPLYLEAEVQKYFSVKAKAKGVDLNTMINDLLKKDIALIEGVN